MSHKYTPELFWTKVKVLGPDDCWEWQGTILNTGYGYLSWRGAMHVAHRIAYALAYDTIPFSAPIRTGIKGFVLHRCDNRACCNPKHLFLGNYSDNQLDSYNKKRHPIINSKLTSDQVREIRKTYTYRGPIDSTVLAIKFGVARKTILDILHNKRYKNVE